MTVTDLVIAFTLTIVGFILLAIIMIILIAIVSKFIVEPILRWIYQI